MILTEFETLAGKDDDCQYELDEGALIKLSPTARPHSRRIERIFRFLITQLPENQYNILPGKLGFVLATEPEPTVRAADLAVMHRNDNPGPGFVSETPLLVIEVISPGNNPEDIEKKRLQYLDAGVPEVWIVYDKTKTIHVFQKSGVKLLFFVCHKDESFTSTLGIQIVGEEIFRA
jgi:Uma2 family endonuclease